MTSSRTILDISRQSYCVYGNEQYKDGLMVLPSVRKEAYYDLSTLEVESNDIFFVTYPRSGTHFSLELVDLIRNNGDCDALRNTHIHQRVVPTMNSPEFMTGKGLKGPLDAGSNPLITAAAKPSPRILHTHASYEFWPEQVKQGKCKIVVMVRNPKSVYTSFYHLVGGMASVPGGMFERQPTWDEFYAAFIENKSSLVPFGTWFDFYSNIWKHRMDIPVHFLNYETMVKDMPKAIKELASFFNKSFSEETIKRMCQHLSFEEFKKNPSTGKAFEALKTSLGENAIHMRKGKIDDWKNMFTVAQSEAFDKLYDKVMAGTEFQQPRYE
ncbi:unnamed protein product [Owenia fusiformis]|uniref:Uncharacterized protein n=1 Tax=Owenia fusiformis TaxID=6347 RepID=A0A8J1XVF3_OWEFU|nr:unnamed protein product [Owenia fusiformis]